MRRTMEILEQARSGSVSPDLISATACKDVAEETGANRVSLWHLEHDPLRVECVCFLETPDTITSGQVLFAKDHPTYFDTVLKENFIVAPDARTHPATAELTEQYLKANDIYSLLDFIIHENFEPVGIICCENAGAPRDWQESDVNYLRQIATLISFAQGRSQDPA